jgi:excisionase family DNA binding protein
MDPEIRTPAITDDGLETVEWAKGFLRVSRSFLYGLMDAGQLPYVKLGRSRRVPRRAVMDLAQQHLVAR